MSDPERAKISDVPEDTKLVRQVTQSKELCPAEIEILRSVVGAWEDFDADAFIEQVYRDRNEGDRPTVFV